MDLHEDFCQLHEPCGSHIKQQRFCPAGLEEELIYPAIREGIDDEEVMNEANEEHHLVHVLVTTVSFIDMQTDVRRRR